MSNSPYKDLKVLVIGDTILDKYIYLKPRKLSPEAPVIIYYYEKADLVLGGACNVACNLRALGANVTYMGIDNPTSLLGGVRVKEMLEDKGIKSVCYSAPNLPVLEKVRYTVDERQLLRVDVSKSYNLSNEDKKYFVDMVLDELYGNYYDAVVISDYAKGTISKYLICEVNCCYKKRRVICNGKPENCDRYYYMDTVIFNQSEMEDALIRTGSNKPEDLYELLKVQHLIETKGANGSQCYCENKHNGNVPTKILQPKDVTGAGDTFLSAYTVELLRTNDSVKAMTFANKVAGLKVQKFKTSAISWEELDISQ